MEPMRGQTLARFAVLCDRVATLWPALFLRDAKVWLFDKQSDRLILWTPVCFGVGIGIYFYLPREPSLFEVSLVPIAPAIAIVVARKSDMARIVLAATLIAAIGFSSAGLCSRWQETRMLDRPLLALDLSGWVASIDRGSSGQRRMILTGVQSKAQPDIPAGIRLSLKEGMKEPQAGSFVRLTAKLHPIPPALWINGYDQQRALFFRGIGAVGEALTSPIVDASPKDWSLVGVRWTIAQRILAIDRGQSGALAVALTVGDRSLISPETDRIMRESGLAHILSISGLHIGLVALLTMAVIRRGFALWPWLALRCHLKKWAAGAAILVAGFYSALAGWDVPVQRSFLSISVVLTAVIADRNPISLRPVAVAAGLVLAIAPDSLLGASFQMSFAAVVMLIGGYERGWIKLARWTGARGIGGWLTLWLIGAIVSSLLATLATLPYAAYHFHRIALYGVISNILVIPLSGLIVMPMAALALFSMPFGLEAMPLAGMMAGLEGLQWVARTIARWPGSSLPVSEMGDTSLLLFSICGLWLCLWRGRSALFVAASLAFVAGVAWWRHPLPDAMIGARQGMVAIALGESLFVAGARPVGLIAEVWRDLTAGAELINDAPPLGSDFGDRRFGCSKGLCLLERHGQRLALALTRVGAKAACGQADILLARPAWSACPLLPVWPLLAPLPVGATGLYLTPSGIAVVTDRQRRGERPWVVLPKTE